MKTLIQAAVVTLIASQAAHAQGAVQWRVSDGGNGHWYRMLITASPTRWEQAKLLAESIGGHLATIRSSGENAVSLAVAEGGPVLPGGSVWLGGIQPTGESSDYAWVTGEPFDWTPGCGFSNTDSGCGFEDRLTLTSPWTGCPWNDVAACWFIPALLVEWSADCNGDGIVDYGQCHDGTLPDYNGNNIPDCCESGSPCVVGNYPVQWRVQDGGNGHWYQLISEVASWAGSRGSAQARGADLCSITTSAENNRVLALVSRASVWCNDGAGYWLGGFRQEGQWRWTTGESFSFSYWGCGNPGEVQTHIQWYRVPTGCPPLGTVVWDDQFPEGCPELQGNPGFVAEWSADCNNDGIVDYGQILQGQLADTNADGIPDICQQPTCVDADFFRDFTVNGADLGILLSQWGPNTPLTVSDLNGDGGVDGADLGVFLSFWGACP
jgi:hypothetical protein